MAQVINTNIASMNAQRNLAKSANVMSTAMERLSSGLRINSAKDDAAGLAISTRFETQIRGINQAVRNANDGISLSQTAESSMAEMTNTLQRMRELAVQAANSTNSDSDRASLQAEVDQLYAELDRISETTAFNGQKVLNGDSRDLIFQIGANAGETLEFSIGSVTTSSLNLNGSSALGELNSGRVAAAAVDAGDVEINGIGIGALVGTEDADGIADVINLTTGQHGVSATAYNTYTGNGGSSGVASGLTINGDTVADSGSMEDLVSNINRDVAGVTAALNTDGSVSLSNDTGADIVVGGVVTNTGLTANTYAGYVSLASADNTAVSLSLGTAGVATDINAFGFNASTGSDNVTGAAVSANALTNTMDITINGVQVGESDSSNATDKAGAINAISAETGVTASASTTQTYTLDFTTIPADGDVQINGADVDLTTAAITNVDELVTTINAAGIQGVKASANTAGELVLSSGQGLDITVDEATTDFFGTGGTLTTRGTLSLTTADGSDIVLGGTTADIAELGLVEQGGSEDAIGLGLSVTSLANASNAIERIDGALEKISSTRGDLGAIQNRFGTTISNLETVSQNLAAANSRIKDADFAFETSQLTKGQILQQAGISILSQANVSSQSVLSLLG